MLFSIIYTFSSGGQVGWFCGQVKMLGYTQCDMYGQVLKILKYQILDAYCRMVGRRYTGLQGTVMLQLQRCY